MIRLGPLKITSCIICEDVRQEISKKFMLIGVYSGDILTKRIPSQVPLTFYLELTSDELGEREFFVRLSGPGKDSADIRVNLNVRVANKSTAVRGPRLTVKLETEGNFKVQGSLDRTKWTTLAHRRVIHDPTLALTGPKIQLEEVSPESLPRQ
jgi:hypothetical protein